MDSSNNSPMRMPLSNDELVLLDQGFEVYHTDSPTPSRLAKMKRQLSLPRRKNRARRRLLTLPSLADDGYDSDEKATAVTRLRWRKEERKKKLIDFEIGSTFLSCSCTCWGGDIIADGFQSPHK